MIAIYHARFTCMKGTQEASSDMIGTYAQTEDRRAEIADAVEAQGYERPFVAVSIIRAGG